MDLKNSDNLQHWDKWKETLNQAVDVGQTVGMTEETMSKIAMKVGNFLSSNIDPENKEQRVIKELWDIGDDHDRKTLSKLMLKIAKHED
ncbi:DUF3243 domain-containing protein [Vallitalea okinawensis]|uniref:DUF3243 domain-containing protein n=1 Tax=Vallitalea okinawensis TaxID=2078660 RepID=UPI000CFB79EA|nr:DUF3243 domain-containing protein [Vallitalea okinawensis]